MNPYFSKVSGLDPYLYEQFRANINPDRRDCCYPGVIGSLVSVFNQLDPQGDPVCGRIWAYDGSGFAWRSATDDDHTGWLLWADERGLLAGNATWDWQ